MGTLAVVDTAPVIELALRSCAVAEVLARDRLDIQRAVKAFELAIGLGVVRGAEAHAHAQADEPDRHVAQAVSARARAAPWRTVVGVDLGRKAIAAEHLDQVRLNVCGVGLGLGLQQQVEARVIVQQRQCVAGAGQGGKAALEVDLPEAVGPVVLEALPGRGCLAGIGADQAMTVQDVRDGAGCGARLAQVGKAPSDLAATPRRVLTPNCQNSLLHGLNATRRAGLRAAAAVPQGYQLAARSGLLGARQPLVTSLRTDAKAAAQGSSIDAFLACKVNKFFAQGHGALLRPDHGNLSLASATKALPMSRHRCYLCPRSKHLTKRLDQKALLELSDAARALISTEAGASPVRLEQGCP